MHYALEDLSRIGVTFGKNVRIDKSVRFFRPDQIRIGNNVRVDCFCLLSAGNDGLMIGNNVHIGVGSQVYASGAAIVMNDFSGLSGRVSLYTSTDDLATGAMTNPTIPDHFRNVKTGAITLHRHALVGCGSVVLPGVELGFGAAVGALTLVRKSVGECRIVSGNPAKVLPIRRDIGQLRAREAEFLSELNRP